MAEMSSVIRLVLRGIAIFLEVLSWIVFADVLLSWISPNGRLKEYTSKIATPIVSPFRSLMNKISKGNSPVDFSPTFALLALFLLSMLVSAISTVL
ncbi:MAG: YggT family protein [Clostridia bacterium]|nr:YggT family protein [Clostridia bacterium]